VAVDKVGFDIRRSEIFGLLGPNGAGKTTTLSAIEGLRRPRSGTVLLNGVDIVRQPALAKAQMGVQLQSTGFQSELTVRQVARLYAGLYGVAMSGQDLDAALTDVGLGRELDRTTKQISGGQQQRLSLFVALIHHPSILLLDEPTTGLDPQSRRYLWTRIERVRNGGGSILLTTHSMEEAQAVCDRVAIVDHGRVLAIDTPRNLIDEHRDDPLVLAAARGEVTLEDVFIGLTGSEIRD
jgi:ABC-2 type transport system ATP-binding protein